MLVNANSPVHTFHVCMQRATVHAGKDPYINTYAPWAEWKDSTAVAISR